MPKDYRKVIAASERVREIAEELGKGAKTRKKPTMAQLRKTGQLERSLNRAHADLLQAIVGPAPPMAPEPAPARVPKAPARAQTASGTTNTAESSVYGFEEFFLAMGSGLVSAQESLDRASLAYLGTLKNQPHVLPSVFRIPKLSAEMKFAVNKEKENSVGFIFFNRKEQAESLNQQTVQFDIVTAPPPADSVAAPFLVRLTLSATRREEVRKFLEKAGQDGDPHGTKPMLEAFDRVLILELGEREYLLVHSGTGGNDVGLWFLVHHAPESLTFLRKFGPPATPGLDAVRALLFKLADRQQTFLKQIQ